MNKYENLLNGFTVTKEELPILEYIANHFAVDSFDPNYFVSLFKINNLRYDCNIMMILYFNGYTIRTDAILRCFIENDYIKLCNLDDINTFFSIISKSNVGKEKIKTVLDNNDLSFLTEEDILNNSKLREYLTFLQSRYPNLKKSSSMNLFKVLNRKNNKDDNLESGYIKYKSIKNFKNYSKQAIYNNIELFDCLNQDEVSAKYFGMKDYLDYFKQEKLKTAPFLSFITDNEKIKTNRLGLLFNDNFIYKESKKLPIEDIIEPVGYKSSSFYDNKENNIECKDYWTNMFHYISNSFNPQIVSLYLPDSYINFMLGWVIGNPLIIYLFMLYNKDLSGYYDATDQFIKENESKIVKVIQETASPYKSEGNVCYMYAKSKDNKPTLNIDFIHANKDNMNFINWIDSYYGLNYEGLNHFGLYYKISTTYKDNIDLYFFIDIADINIIYFLVDKDKTSLIEKVINLC